MADAAFLASKTLAALILPPAGPLLAALLGMLVAAVARTRFLRWGGLVLAASSQIGLLVLSLPVAGDRLMASLDRYPPIAGEQLKQVGAIVILGGGAYQGMPEYGGDTVSASTLERLRYGARLARASKRPVLVSGGAPFGGRTEGELMKEALAEDFGIAVRWTETASRNTAENAALCAALLAKAGVSRIALVSHSWHLPRAKALFEKQGLSVVPAPTLLSGQAGTSLPMFLPGDGSAGRMALREYLGLLYNRIAGAV